VSVTEASGRWVDQVMLLRYEDQWLIVYSWPQTVRAVPCLRQMRLHHQRRQQLTQPQQVVVSVLRSVCRVQQQALLEDAGRCMC